MTIRFKARHADANDVVQPDGWWIEGEGGELAPGTRRGPYERRLDARKALDAGRRPFAVLIARTEALAADLGKTPPAPVCYQVPSCIRQQQGSPPTKAFQLLDDGTMCGACAAYWHVTMAGIVLRRVQAADEAVLAKRHRFGRPDGIQHAGDEPSEAQVELRRMGEAL